jgi:hypothetical protein
MRIIPFLYILIFAFQISFSQNDSARLLPANLRIAYNSSIIYPGAAVGIDFPVQSIELTNIKSDGSSKSVCKLRFLSATLGYYHHEGFHDNIYLIPEWVMRRSKAGTWFTEFSAGLGYSRTFLGGTTYTVNNNGIVNIVPLAGYNYAIAAFGYGLGYNYSTKKKIPLCIYSRLSLLLMFPYNSTIYPRPTLELGLSYTPSHFLERKICTIHKEKSHQ